ncbi:MAG: histidine--tRNA ligase [Caldilineaceae bacterium]|nr:histidine--tRNA ligase [Caldilineaceae bacterium]
MARFNTAPVSGTRDFLPLDVLRRNYVIDIIERIYQSYGFEPLETPTMERLDTLLGKYGDEGDQLIFRVAKRGAKLERALVGNPTESDIADEGLRYDLTVPLARVVAEYRNQLPRYFKRYQIAPVYRADRPAKGRYREFYQCDVDIVGSKSLMVEAEVLNAGAQVLQELGFRGVGEEGFRLRLNHRGVLKGLMEVAGVQAALEGSVLVAIDKLDKIGIDGVREELLGRGLDEHTTAHLLQTLTAAPTSVAETLSWLSDVLEASEAGSRGVTDLKQVVAYTAQGPAHAHLHIDPFLARGLSYYTGPIYEIEFIGLSGSGGAGGRYDDLIGMFSNQTIPACGFSLGLERILLIMDERGMFPTQLAGQPQVLVTQFDESTIEASLHLTHQLRAAGLRVDLYPDLDRYGRQFKYADERKIRYALLIGPEEIARQVVAVKDLTSGDQREVAIEEITTWLQQQILHSL